MSIKDSDWHRVARILRRLSGGASMHECDRVAYLHREHCRRLYGESRTDAAARVFALLQKEFGWPGTVPAVCPTVPTRLEHPDHEDP